MSREYRSYKAEDLERLFDKERSNQTICERILKELSHRKTRRALKLKDRISQHLAINAGPSSQQNKSNVDAPNDANQQALTDQKSSPYKGNLDSQRTLFDSEPTTEESTTGIQELLFDSEPAARSDLNKPKVFSLIRPPGTSNLPAPRIRSYDQDLSLSVSSSDDAVKRFPVAIEELIKEIKTTNNGQVRYELSNGIQVDSANQTYVYQFAFTEEANIFEDAQVDVSLNGKKLVGQVISISSGSILIAVDEDLGQEINHLILTVDTTALLQALKERIEQVSKGEISINQKLANAVLGETALSETVTAIPHSSSLELNQEQFATYIEALKKPIIFVWGPPGCGKTHTLAEIVRALFDANLRTLVCSNTNRAVDQILLKICSNLGIEHPAMIEGKIVRLGRVADERLRSDFYEYVSLDGIAARKSEDLIKEKEEIEAKISLIDNDTLEAQTILRKFSELDRQEQKLKSLTKLTNDLAQQGKTEVASISDIDQKLSKLDKELEARTAARFRLFHRSEAQILSDKKISASQRDSLSIRAKETKTKYDTTRADFDKQKEVVEALRQPLASVDRHILETKIQEAEQKRAPLVARLAEIDSLIADIEASIMRDASVIGATCTKSYLSVRDIGKFDYVIVDEASMVLLPMVWFSAGLSTSRVLICGDFRQIPPIVQTKQQSIFDILGSDVFTHRGFSKNPENSLELECLKVQFRMQPDICNLISDTMYSGLLTTSPKLGKPRNGPPAPLGACLTIIDTSDVWPFENVNAFFSRFNVMHALLARNLCWHLNNEAFVEDNSSVGICTPYSAQAKLIAKLIESESLQHKIQTGTVHRYQGDERDLMILEIPESIGGQQYLGQFIQGAPSEDVGARLINVAISRARNSLIFIANLTYLDEKLPASSLLRSALYQAQEKGCVVPATEVLKLRPIEKDLEGIFGEIELDTNAQTFGLFSDKTFEPAFIRDVNNAKESIIIFSGFVTPQRVAKYADLFRLKINNGVKIRCVTRPPERNGSIPPELGKQALDALEGIGAIVDCRTKIHEKVIVIDREVVWTGSLNALSHTDSTDEVMTRIKNRGFADSISIAMVKNRVSSKKALADFTSAENPRCGDCGARTTYIEGRFGPFFGCENNCGWTRSLGAADSSTATNDSDLPKIGPSCPDCGAQTRLKQSRFGAFYGCSDYPKCKGKVRIN